MLPPLRPLYDSRRLYLSGEEYIFFALRSERRDGHNYIEELYAKNVRHFVVENIHFEALKQRFPDANFYSCPSPLKFLQSWASKHRQQAAAADLRVVGIAGSYGKTTVKEWLYELISEHSIGTKTPKSYNSQIGVPLAVLSLENYHKWAIFEAATSEKGEMQQLAPIIAPHIALLTNIGSLHETGFSSITEKIRENALLFASCERIFYDGTPLIGEILAEMYPRTLLQPIRLLPADHQEAPQLGEYAFIWQNESANQLILRRYGSPDLPLVLPFNERRAVLNALQAFVLALQLGIPENIAAEKLLHIRRVPLRLSQKQGNNNVWIIEDSYSSDLQGLSVGLEFVQQHSPQERCSLILAELSPREQPAAVYKQLRSLLAAARLQRIFLVGKDWENAAADWKDENLFFYPDGEQILKDMRLHRIAFENETLFIKGSRALGLERIAQHLQQQVHDTRLSISLPAIANNYRVYRRLLLPSTRIMCMVKAFAYGSGGVEVARALAFMGVDYLGVAYADEGATLRRAGIKTPIMVMNANEYALPSIIENDLQPVVYGWNILQQLLDYLHYTQPEKPLRVHLEIDTGMRRLGFDADSDSAQLLQILHQEQKYIQIESVFSHLSAAESPQHDDFTRLQIERLRAFSDAYAGSDLGAQSRPLWHILNTAGISRWAALAQWDLVRLGIGLHGIDGNEFLRRQLLPTSRLTTTISQIRPLLPSQSVGYSRNGSSPKATRIATIAIGYADGFPRTAGGGRTSVWINGRLCPTIGNVCMDMSFVDLGADSSDQEGDEVLIFGEERPIEALAADLHTIPYEILTSVSMRIPRLFFED